MPESAKIPFHLGKCEILKVHDDGDVTAECEGKKYVVTTEGEVFTELDVGYYGSLIGEVAKKYLRGKITKEQFLKEVEDVRQMLR